MERHQRIQQKAAEVGSRHHRKLGKFSQGFNENFMFFFLLSRRGLIDFCGERILVEHDVDGPGAKMCFKHFEDGKYSMGRVITSRHPNVMRHVLMGKKGFGLWVREWSGGISEGSFKKQDILDEFATRGISIPDCFMQEFENAIYKATLKMMEKL